MSDGLSVTDSVWGKKKNEVLDEPVVSFLDIMSEELAEQLDETKFTDSANMSVFDTSLVAYGLDASLEGASDLEIARALQEKFDLEQAAYLKAEEEKKNPNKVEVNFRHFQDHYDPDWDDSEESEGEEELLAQASCHRYDTPAKEDFPPCGFIRGTSGNVITKHDKEIAEKRNMDKVLELPLSIPTGDVVGEKISNKVYNSLRNCGKTEVKRSARLKDKDEKATYDQSIDAVTRMILYKWINSGELFDSVEGVIATGKESVVLHGTTRGDSFLNVKEQHYAVKVYKMTLSEFKNRSEYVYNDYRFKNPRRVLRVWAEKEFMNLHRMTRAGLKCPEPIRLKKHVMLMSLIGSHGVAAAKLKNIDWGDQESKSDAFQQTREAMGKMFKDCCLVHGDLSEFNLLYHEGNIYIIDVSQAMDSSHPRALFFLLRDIRNVLDFFVKIGTENLPSSTEMFNEITGLNMDPNKNLLVQVEHFEHDNRGLQLHEDKAKPADMEWRLYDAEIAASTTREDPAVLYN